MRGVDYVIYGEGGWPDGAAVGSGGHKRKDNLDGGEDCWRRWGGMTGWGNCLW